MTWSLWISTLIPLVYRKPNTMYHLLLSRPANSLVIVSYLSQPGESFPIEVSKESVRFASEGEAANARNMKERPFLVAGLRQRKRKQWMKKKRRRELRMRREQEEENSDDFEMNDGQENNVEFKPKYFSSAEFDIFTIRESIKVARTFMAAPTWNGWIRTSTDRRRNWRNTFTTIFHTSGIVGMCETGSRGGGTGQLISIWLTVGLRVECFNFPKFFFLTSTYSIHRLIDNSEWLLRCAAVARCKHRLYLYFLMCYWANAFSLYLHRLAIRSDRSRAHRIRHTVVVRCKHHLIFLFLTRSLCMHSMQLVKFSTICQDACTSHPTTQLPPHPHHRVLIIYTAYKSLSLPESK